MTPIKITESEENEKSFKDASTITDEPSTSSGDDEGEPRRKKARTTNKSSSNDSNSSDFSDVTIDFSPLYSEEYRSIFGYRYRDRNPTPPPLPVESELENNNMRMREEFYNWDYSRTTREPPDLGPMDEEEEMYFNELEVASISGIPENPIENEDSSSLSEFDDERNQGNLNESINIVNDQKSEEYLADGEQQENDSDVDGSRSDFELTERNKWLCEKCQSNTLPYLRYCQRCFRIRRNWLPKRPISRRLKQRNRRKRAEARRNRQIRCNNNNPIETLTNCRNTTRTTAVSNVVVDLNQAFLDDCGDDQTDTDIISNPQNIISIREEFPTPPNSQETIEPLLPSNVVGEIVSNLKDNHDGRNSISSNNDCPDFTVDVNNACSVCCTSEKNAAFVHKKSAHNFGCYRCSVKILKRDGKCPICREKVLRVVKIIVA